MYTLSNAMSCAEALVDMHEGSEQYRFLERDLASVDRARTPWVIFMGHRPIYSCWGRDSDIGAVEDLLMMYRVDLSLWGHVHNAQVTCPVYRSRCVEKGADGYDAPIHAVIGNAGQEITFEKLIPTIENYTEFYAMEYGFSTLVVDGGRTLTMNYYGDLNSNGTQIAGGGFELHYTFTIDKTARGAQRR